MHAYRHRSFFSSVFTPSVCYSFSYHLPRDVFIVGLFAFFLFFPSSSFPIVGPLFWRTVSNFCSLQIASCCQGCPSLNTDDNSSVVAIRSFLICLIAPSVIFGRHVTFTTPRNRTAFQLFLFFLWQSSRRRPRTTSTYLRTYMLCIDDNSLSLLFLPTLPPSLNESTHEENASANSK